MLFTLPGGFLHRSRSFSTLLGHWLSCLESGLAENGAGKACEQSAPKYAIRQRDCFNSQVAGDGTHKRSRFAKHARGLHEALCSHASTQFCIRRSDLGFLLARFRRAYKAGKVERRNVHVCKLAQYQVCITTTGNILWRDPLLGHSNPQLRLSVFPGGLPAAVPALLRNPPPKVFHVLYYS